MKITLLQLKPTKWRLRIETRDEFDRRKFSYVMVHGTEDDAKAKRAEILEAGVPPNDRPVQDKFGPYITQWLEDRHAFGQIADTSLAAYKYLFAHAIELLGHKPLRDLKPADVQAPYRSFARGYGVNRTRDLAIQLRKALREAVNMGLIDADPTERIDPPKAQRAAKDSTLSEDDIARLVQHSETWGDIGLMIRFSIATGCRRGEVCGLQWQDVDLTKGVVQILRNVKKVGNEIKVSTTKTRSGTRRITLPEDMVAELAARKGSAAPTAWVFGNPFGKVRDPDWVTKTIRRKFATLGLGDFTFHDLRHAHATFLLQQKWNPKAVSQRLGHSDIKITLGIYAHVMPGDDEHLASAINSLLCKGRGVQNQGKTTP